MPWKTISVGLKIRDSFLILRNLSNQRMRWVLAVLHYTAIPSDLKKKSILIQMKLTKLTSVRLLRQIPNYTRRESLRNYQILWTFILYYFVFAVLVNVLFSAIKNATGQFGVNIFWFPLSIADRQVNIEDCNEAESAHHVSLTCNFYRIL